MAIGERAPYEWCVHVDRDRVRGVRFKPNAPAGPHLIVGLEPTMDQFIEGALGWHEIAVRR